MAAVLIVLVYRVARELKVTHTGAVLAAAITALNPLVVYYAKTTNLDVPYTMWFVASMLYGVRAFASHRY